METNDTDSTGASLPPTSEGVPLALLKSLSCGPGTRMELTLIRPGSFVMGLKHPGEGRSAIPFAAVATVALLMCILIATGRERRRFAFCRQFSLGRLVLFTLSASAFLWCVFLMWERTIEQRKLALELKAYNEAVWEKPAHVVFITRPFYIGRFEVTNAQYAAVVGTTIAGSPDTPVVMVNWMEATRFCERLSKLTGTYVRLPTEAEWEYACRAGSPSVVQDQKRSQVALYDKNAGGRLQKVGTKAPNAWGVYDMLGNAVEWCHDFHGSYAALPLVDPRGPDADLSGCDCRVARGGGYNDLARVCTEYRRFGIPARQRGGSLGFRIVVEVSGAR